MLGFVSKRGPRWSSYSCFPHFNPLSWDIVFMMNPPCKAVNMMCFCCERSFPTAIHELLTWPLSKTMFVMFKGCNWIFIALHDFRSHCKCCQVSMVLADGLAPIWCHDICKWQGVGHIFRSHQTFVWWYLQGSDVYVPSQWEMVLHCNTVSHWLGAHTEWSLSLYTYIYLQLWIFHVLHTFSSSNRKCSPVCPPIFTKHCHHDYIERLVDTTSVPLKVILHDNHITK